MPYTKFQRGGKYYIRNRRTGRTTGYRSEEARQQGIRIREAYAHGWKPTGLARASKSTRRRVASMGGRARRR